jgi:uncharacterized protein YegP (UPF0339 family)
MNVIHVYKGAGGRQRWRWRVVAANGRVVADSGEAYLTKWNAKRAAKRLHPGLTLRETTP